MSDGTEMMIIRRGPPCPKCKSDTVEAREYTHPKSPIKTETICMICGLRTYDEPAKEGDAA